MGTLDHESIAAAEANLIPVRSMIHVVDDDFDVLKSLCFLFETEGFNVRTFRSGAALLSSDAQNDADCFVIDYKMPDIDGIELTRKLRELDVDIPVVLFTGYPDRSFSAKAASVGVRHILFKPHLGEKLISHVRAAIRRNDFGRQ